MRRTTPARRALAALAATVALLATAACGGGGSDRPDPDEQAGKELSRTVFPADSDFTARQLDRALPTAAQVRGGGKVQVRCHPGRKTVDCPPATQAAYGGVVLTTKLPGQRVTRDHAKPGWWRPELYDVTVKRYTDRSAAAAGWDTQVGQLQPNDGAISTAARKTARGQTWGAKGIGQVSRTKVLGLDGYQVLATVRDVDLAGHTSKPVQVGIVTCRWGQEQLSVKVVLWDERHEPGDALVRASAAAEQYLRRLGRSR